MLLALHLAALDGSLAPEPLETVPSLISMDVSAVHWPEVHPRLAKQAADH